jgi:hypothetical protein
LPIAAGWEAVGDGRMAARQAAVSMRASAASAARPTWTTLDGPSGNVVRLLDQSEAPGGG